MNLPVARASLLPEALRSNFAVVVPAYNEVESVPALFAALRDTFDRHGLDGEVIFVDDGSRDGTYDAASLHGEGIPRLRLLRHRRNLGKTEAMVSAAQVATAEYLILFDADLQHSTEEFPRFLAKLGEGWDIVTGRKRGQYEKRGGGKGTYDIRVIPTRWRLRHLLRAAGFH